MRKSIIWLALAVVLLVITAITVLIISNKTGAVWKEVYCGDGHTIALKTDGLLWAWGNNNLGQLGVEDNTEYRSLLKFTTTTIIGEKDSRTENVPYINSPLQVGYDTDWSAVASGCEHTIALKADGTLWCWGAYWYGYDGTETITKTIPTRIGADTDWLALSAGGYHNIALKTNGTLWGWGEIYFGDGGAGCVSTCMTRTNPTRIGTDTDWKSIACGWNYAFAIKTDGTLWAWGANYDGQLGDGTTISKTLPTRIGADTNWAKVSTGGHHTIALKTDGTLWAWGQNYHGQLGNGQSGDWTPITAPTRIGADTDWTEILAGGTHNVALKANGTLWGWGDNSFNKSIPTIIGAHENWVDNSLSKTTPTKIGADINWAKVSAGGGHTIALKTDGTLWAWGWNYYGQLGLGDTAGRNIPTQVIQR